MGRRILGVHLVRWELRWCLRRNLGAHDLFRKCEVVIDGNWIASLLRTGIEYCFQSFLSLPDFFQSILEFYPRCRRVIRGEEVQAVPSGELMVPQKTILLTDQREIESVPLQLDGLRSKGQRPHQT